MIPRPPFDPELEVALLAHTGSPISGITPEMILSKRAEEFSMPRPRIALEAAGIQVRDVSFAGSNGDPIGLSVLTHPAVVAGRGTIYFIHGGGMVFGDRWSGLDRFIPWITELGLTVVTIDYRLAPEFAHPTPFEDSYAGYAWTIANASALGIDPERIIVAGTSAGGGLAAAVVLAARDRGIQAPIGQLLMYPMLDDRDDTVSTVQFSSGGLWDRVSNDTGWGSLLGARRGGSEVSPYAAPSRESDLTRLPPAFIDCGSAEVFRDEDVAYASAIWAAGGEAELHVWPGGFHAFEGFVPEAQLSLEMMSAREAWLRRILRF